MLLRLRLNLRRDPVLRNCIFSIRHFHIPAAISGLRLLTADGKRRRAHGFMVAAQTCMAVILVVGAGLLVRTFQEIKRIDPGFSTGSVLTNIRYGQRPGGRDALDWLRLVGMEHLADRSTHNLSGGEVRRVALARDDRRYHGGDRRKILQCTRILG